MCGKVRIKGVDSRTPSCPEFNDAITATIFTKLTIKVRGKVKLTKLRKNLLFVLLPAGEAAFLQDFILVVPSSGSRLWCVAKGRVRLAFIVLEITSLEQAWLYRGNEGKKS